MSRSQDPPRLLDPPGSAASLPLGSEMSKRLENLKPLRVCRIITRLNVGGPSVQATLLSKSLVEFGFETLLVAGIEDAREGNFLNLLPSEELDSLEVVTVPSLRRAPDLRADAAALARLAAIVRSFRPDIVHTHMAKAGTLGRLVARATGVPVVIHTFHGNVFSGYFSKPAATAVRAWEAFLSRLSTAVIAISPSQAVQLEEAGIPRSKIKMIPLGVPLKKLVERAKELGDSPGDAKLAARKLLGLPEKAFTICWVARLVPIKDPDLMLEAVASLAGLSSSVALLIVGDGPMREAVLQRARELGVEVFLRSWTPDLVPCYLAADVVALSSKNEGFPVSLIEALSLGKPVASTDVGGVSDLIEAAGSGVLAKERTADALAEAIQRAASIPEAQLAISARRVADSFDATILTRRMADLYTELAYSKVHLIERRRRRWGDRRLQPAS